MPAPTNGLILFWNMETLSGAAMDDLSPTGNNGTIAGTANHANGQVGAARGFDGVDDKITADSRPLGPTAGSFTLTMWLKPLASGSKLPVSMDDNADHYVTFGNEVASRFSWVQSLTGGAAATTAVLNASSTSSTGVYTHIAIRYNGHTKYLFRNSVTQASAVQTGTFTWNSFNIGQRAGNLNPYNGDIDELRIYNRALSLSEISDIYNDTTEYPVIATAMVDLGELTRPLRPFRRVNRWSTMRKSEFQDR